ncbi:hypothetical protein FBU30_010516 [Linnemannia zychae]|nr:hypothetical protein FBU30_010516 [Linnemannia zychae]
MEINPAVTFKHDRKVMYAKRPKVLIVGAGLGGLTLAAVLEKSNIPYEIFERAAQVKPLVPELYGADTRALSRPELYDLIMRQVPNERIHFSKKILTTKQGGNGVLIRCSDGSEYEGDILVGADGAHSAIRQNLYEQLKKNKNLPSSDDVPLPFSVVCLVGQTRQLTPTEFPLLAEEKCQFIRVIGDDRPYACNTFTTAQSTVCWSLYQFLNSETSKDNDSFRNSEWGPEAAGAMCEQVRDFPIIAGGDKKLTVGDLIDWTPKDLISKVMLEEKVFKTWHGCRTVLLGDACHKLNPSGGAGAVNAMHDAIVLANYINGLPFHPVVEEIEAAFAAYRAERIEWVERAFVTSSMGRNAVAKGYKAVMMRFVIKHMPDYMRRRVEQSFTCRPQISFLPLVNIPSVIPAAEQPSLKVKTPVEPEDNKTVV